MAGRLFRELAQEMSKEIGSGVLYTGQPDTIRFGGTNALTVVQAPIYNKKSLPKRFLSWLLYFFFAFYYSLLASKTTLLFFSTNPPILPIIGFLNRKFFGKRYIVLVYDIYPEIPIALGWIKKNGLIARFWLFLNKLAYENADAVFTIGEYMAKNLERQFDPQKTKTGKIIVVPPWVDMEFIKPLKKSENWFARKYGQVGKYTVLYSGNLGATHDIECIVDLAKRLEHEKNIQFLIIGSGYKQAQLEDRLMCEKLSNILLLPSQPEETLSNSLTTGDLAIISMATGTEGYMVPSSLPYYLAAGCDILYMGRIESEIGAFCSSESPENGFICNSIEEAEALIKNLSIKKGCKAPSFYSEKYDRLFNTAKFISTTQEFLHTNLMFKQQN